MTVLVERFIFQKSNGTYRRNVPLLRTDSFLKAIDWNIKILLSKSVKVLTETREEYTDITGLNI